MIDKFPCLLISVFFCVTGCLHQPEPPVPGKSKEVSAPSEPDAKIVHSDWLYWRGPTGMGVSDQTGLPDDLNKSLSWTHEIQGGGVPVIAGGRAYQFGYYGVEDDLQEALVCFDAATGKVLWERRHSDFVSDIVYNRYGVGAACVDPATGNVYFQTSPGLLIGYDSDGNQLWERSLMEEFARLTFPNGRTGGPCVDGNLVIIHAITANWGKQGPARDRFYAFDKSNGELVWSSTPGITPKDSSFSPLAFEDLPDGRRVFYSGTGCGHVVCIDARTGQALWRFQMSYGGVNSGVVIHEDTVVAIHGKENVDSTVIGRMVAIRKPASLPGVGEEILVLGKEAEVWRNNSMEAFTSTPAYRNGRLYSTIKRGELVCVDAETGEDVWVLKLAPDQVHASPLWADGKLFVPMFDGRISVVVDEGDSGRVLGKTTLDGACLAAPSAAHGRVFVQTKKRLYCFGSSQPAPAFVAKPQEELKHLLTGPPIGSAVSLQVVPAEFALKSGTSQAFKVYALDRTGRRIEEVKEGLAWEKWIPPTAKVQSMVDAEIDETGILVADMGAKLSAGALRVSKGGLYGVTRGRVLQDLPYEVNFEQGFDLKNTSTDDIAFSYPPLAWLGARMRWQVQKSGDNYLAGNTLDRVLFQRAINFVGHKDMNDYTMEADVMTDGDRRTKSNIGLINQRYVFALIGNGQKLEVFSNYDRFRHSVPFSVKTNVWYRLKTRVDLLVDGTGMIRAKSWEKGSPEPSEWTLEVPHAVPHRNGAPGIYAMSPQSKRKVFFDNVLINYNK
ncbi:MAG: PQQ-binding-like beta-propeller repeat protein [Opitutae bacterium]|jgi:outer membrane protein assembly factor BamB|nr:PQQ-binding-like beta-propeller repeat protein [Opitutae bacterium]